MTTADSATAALLGASVVGVRPRPWKTQQYDLLDENETDLGSVVRHESGLGTWLLGDVPEQHWLVSDASEQPVFLLHKPRHWGAQHFSVVDATGTPVGELQQVHLALTFQFELTTADGTKGRIHARHVLGGRHWTIEDGAGTEVGQVTNQFPAMAHLFTQPDTFVVELGDITGQFRQLALAAAVCLQVVGASG